LTVVRSLRKRIAPLVESRKVLESDETPQQPARPELDGTRSKSSGTKRMVRKSRSPELGPSREINADRARSADEAAALDETLAKIEGLFDEIGTNSRLGLRMSVEIDGQTVDVFSSQPG
jgi:hypothetical protein